ncbi:polyisoprenoid-binding protein YceI [Fontibacillus phaseoli]|uniref:Polyisoprenoid-binding protein YceI n=1 Tax=Fontibacillus phaseoli TaxID=1416533 RepID=A0A369BPF6_9BACL|nr:YceI family protein [Fontibacillus phaseoli]RCX22518.1 polyisoprenoid-binding protein YceI [Fontibacillus phaseoli]
MNKKTRNWIITGAAAILLVGAGGYAFLDHYLGNQVQITKAIPAGSSTVNSAPADAAANAAGNQEGAVVDPAQLNGEWVTAADSKVYFSVTTSRETVNFENTAVSGNWVIDLEEPAKMKADGKINMTQVSSGNGQRDGHIQQAEFFNVAEFPEASFTASSFEGLPAKWTEGSIYDLTMNGTLTVKGIDKEVSFDGQALYQEGQVRLSGLTKVTFADFGMENPHSVVLETENDISVQLELVLER